MGCLLVHPPFPYSGFNETNLHASQLISGENQHSVTKKLLEHFFFNTETTFMGKNKRIQGCKRKKNIKKGLQLNKMLSKE